MVNITTTFYGPELAMFVLTEVLQVALLIVASIQLHHLRLQGTWSLLRYFMLLLVIICVSMSFSSYEGTYLQRG